MKNSKLSLVLISMALSTSCLAQKAIRLDNARIISRMTGDTLESEKFLSPNHTGSDYDVFGTDLGIIWQMDRDRVGIFFGDTSGAGFKPFNNGGNGSNWRSNVLAFSSDGNLEDGLQIDSMAVDADGKAREIFFGGKSNPDPDNYFTSIPTSAIHAGKLDCVHYMNIYNWGAPKGRWRTHFSSLYTSSDGGATWERRKEVTFDQNSHFSQVAFGKKGGKVYMIGTYAGRGGDAYLARFNEDDILDMSRYEYWNGKKWVRGKESAAVPIIKGPIGEASLLYHKKYHRWIYTFTYDPNQEREHQSDRQDIFYMSTDDITDWKGEKRMISIGKKGGMYGGFMHPSSADGDTLYYVLSFWGPYNTFLVAADITLE